MNGGREGYLLYMWKAVAGPDQVEEARSNGGWTESHQSEFTPGLGTIRYDRTKPFELLSCIPNYKHPILCMYPSYPCNHPTKNNKPPYVR